MNLDHIQIVNRTEPATMGTEPAGPGRYHAYKCLSIEVPQFHLENDQVVRLRFMVSGTSLVSKTS